VEAPSLSAFWKRSISNFASQVGLAFGKSGPTDNGEPPIGIRGDGCLQFVLRFREPIQVQKSLGERFMSANVSWSNSHGFLQNGKRFVKSCLLMKRSPRSINGSGVFLTELSCKKLLLARTKSHPPYDEARVGKSEPVAGERVPGTQLKAFLKCLNGLLEPVLVVFRSSE